MPAASGASKKSDNRVKYKKTNSRKKRRMLPTGVPLANGVTYKHKALQFLEKRGMEILAASRRLMRETVENSTTYTDSNGPDMMSFGDAVHKLATSQKALTVKLLAAARCRPGLKIGKPPPRKKLSVKDYVGKFLAVVYEYDVTSTEKARVDAMTTAKQKQVILAVKRANLLGLKLSLNEALEQYKASTATRKPTAAGAGSTGTKAGKVKAPPTPEQGAATMWQTTAQKGDKLPPQFVEFVGKVNGLGEMPAMERWYLLFRWTYESVRTHLWNDSQNNANTKAREKSETLYGKVLSLNRLVDKAAKNAGEHASTTEVVKNIGDSTMMEIIAFIRVRLGFRPTNTKPGAPGKKPADQQPVPGASGSEKQPADQQPADQQPAPDASGSDQQPGDETAGKSGDDVYGEDGPYGAGGDDGDDGAGGNDGDDGNDGEGQGTRPDSTGYLSALCVPPVGSPSNLGERSADEPDDTVPGYRTRRSVRRD